MEPIKTTTNDGRVQPWKRVAKLTVPKDGQVDGQEDRSVRVEWNQNESSAS